MILSVRGAYGRDYQTKQAAIAAWEDGKDFLILGPVSPGSYISSRDAGLMMAHGFAILCFMQGGTPRISDGMILAYYSLTEHREMNIGFQPYWITDPVSPRSQEL